MFEILKVLAVLAIAIPFGYIVFDVVWDLSKRLYSSLKPIPVKISEHEKQRKK